MFVQQSTITLVEPLSKVFLPVMYTAVVRGTAVVVVQHSEPAYVIPQSESTAAEQNGQRQQLRWKQDGGCGASCGLEEISPSNLQHRRNQCCQDIDRIPIHRYSWWPRTVFCMQCFNGGAGATFERQTVSAMNFHKIWRWNQNEKMSHTHKTDLHGTLNDCRY